MRIGIITLIDVNNYGGAFQAAAIQDYLRKAGHDAVLLHVQYNKRRNPALKFIERPGKGVVEIIKERKFAAFRERHFRAGGLPAYGLERFLDEAPEFDAYLCGSDQIWNSGNCADPLRRRLFFLDFGAADAKRVAYAASWGAKTLDEGVRQAVADCLDRFDAISAREKSGVEIVEGLGKQARWVPDPVLLHAAGYWEDIADEALKKAVGNTLFKCEYRWTPCVPFADVQKLLCGKYGWDVATPFSNRPLREFALTRCLSPQEWLDNLRRAPFVLTNSYHALLFSIIFKRQFLAIPLIGKYAGMNERIFSVAERLGLEDRLLTKFEPDQIIELAEKPINWERVGRELADWRHEADAFLKTALQS
ncbi:MAG: polysaccharide pyruvyl transferase family protein [Kiritimatiellae bacterium]|nr:polysaccharide pyruvyl transferase family protein [Kiritimatiellia bacterium]